MNSSTSARMNKVLDLMSYLGKGKNHDEHTFWHENGTPDIAAARAFAEDMRSQLGRLLDTSVSVDQRVNKVTITLLIKYLEPAA